jgi:hypothetical protein
MTTARNIVVDTYKFFPEDGSCRCLSTKIHSGTSQKTVMIIFLFKCFRKKCPAVATLSGSRDSSVGIATGYGLDDRGVEVRVPVGSRIFSSPRVPPNLLSNACRRLFRGRGREAHHSPPNTAEVKKMWFYTSTPPYAFMV